MKLQHKTLTDQPHCRGDFVFLGGLAMEKNNNMDQYYRNEKDTCARHAVPPSIAQRVPRVALGLCLVASAHNHHHLQWVELQGEVVVQLFSTCFFVGDDEYLFFDTSMTIGMRGGRL